MLNSSYWKTFSAMPRQCVQDLGLEAYPNLTPKVQNIVEANYRPMLAFVRATEALPPWWLSSSSPTPAMYGFLKSGKPLVTRQALTLENPCYEGRSPP